MIKCYLVMFFSSSLELVQSIVILADNNLLKKNKGPIERNKGVTINWQCLSQNCYFRATTVDADIERTNGSHNHDPNIELFVKREGRIKLKEAVAVSDAPLASVCYTFLLSFGNCFNGSLICSCFIVLGRKYGQNILNSSLVLHHPDDLFQVVLNVIAGTTNDEYLTAHGSNAAMKQCARRFKQSQYPDLGKQLAIKVDHEIKMLTPKLIKMIVGSRH